MLTVIAYLVLIMSFLNLLRMAAFMVGSDLYDLRRHKKRLSAKTSLYKPLVSVLIPAHNEELVLQRNMMSVYNSDYKNIELIVINDSSTDRTKTIARSFQKKYGKRFSRMKVLNVNVRGKAPALNAALKHVKGTLFMCLDADSALKSDAISTAVQHFKNDRNLACITSNVKIFPSTGSLNLLQRVEYMVSSQTKKAEAVSGTQYIVGGTGSMFRTRLVRRMGGYDATTITEDIDLSMKILSHYGSKRFKISHFSDVITYTEAVPDFGGLVRQRYRWKYGRYQSFLKNRQLFFSRRSDVNKLLSWLYLPYALFGELLFLLEPVVFGYIIFLLTQYGDVAIVAASFAIFAFYIGMHAWGATAGYTVRERVRLFAAMPLVYLGMYALSFVEYTATIRGLLSLPKVFKQHKNGTGSSAWKHVKRTGNASIVS